MTIITFIPESGERISLFEKQALLLMPVIQDYKDIICAPNDDDADGNQSISE